MLIKYSVKEEDASEICFFFFSRDVSNDFPEKKSLHKVLRGTNFLNPSTEIFKGGPSDLGAKILQKY